MNRKLLLITWRIAGGRHEFPRVWHILGASLGSPRAFCSRRLAALAILICIAGCLPYAPAAAADDWLPISPEELAMTSEPKAPGAPAIYLYRQVDRNDQSSVENDYVRIKVLTEEGRKRGDVEILYFTYEGSIRNIKARTIQPNGSIINFDGKIYDKTVIKAGDLKFAAKTFTLPDVQVGSIIEYRYTVEENPYLVFFSHWVLNEDLFTRHAQFSVKLNEGFTSRWHGHRLPPGVSLPKASPDHHVRLAVTDVPAFEEEEYSPPQNEVRSVVDFIYTSNSESDKTKYWKAEDKRMNDVVESFVGKHKEIAQAAAEIAPPSDPSNVRLQKLYAKVQSFRNTSYEVEKTSQEEKREKGKAADNVVDVWKKGAGNGLQLTWLYLGLVRAAGFQAFPVAVAHRNRTFFQPESLNSSLLSDQIVLVKDGGVDKYFDPGTALTPFGLLPWSETNVNGLCLDKDGGTWVETPLPASADSRTIRKAALKLDPEGTLSGKLTLTFTGLTSLGHRQYELNEDDTHRKAYLEQVAQGYIPVGSVVELTNQPDWTSSSSEFVAEFNIKVPGWVAGAGRKGLMSVGVFSNSEKHLFEHASRTSPIYFHYPYQTTDDVTIDLPLGWHVGSLPPPQKLDKKMVVYEDSVEEKAGVLHLSRALSVNGILLGPQYYPSLRGFFQYVKNWDEQQIIVIPGYPGSHN